MALPLEEELLLQRRGAEEREQALGTEGCGQEGQHRPCTRVCWACCAEAGGELAEKGPGPHPGCEGKKQQGPRLRGAGGATPTPLPPAEFWLVKGSSACVRGAWSSRSRGLGAPLRRPLGLGRRHGPLPPARLWERGGRSPRGLTLAAGPPLSGRPRCTAWGRSRACGTAPLSALGAPPVGPACGRRPPLQVGQHGRGGGAGNGRGCAGRAASGSRPPAPPPCSVPPAALVSPPPCSRGADRAAAAAAWSCPGQGVGPASWTGPGTPRGRGHRVQAAGLHAARASLRGSGAPPRGAVPLGLSRVRCAGTRPRLAACRRVRTPPGVSAGASRGRGRLCSGECRLSPWTPPGAHAPRHGLASPSAGSLQVRLAAGSLCGGAWSCSTRASGAPCVSDGWDLGTPRWSASSWAAGTRSAPRGRAGPGPGAGRIWTDELACETTGSRCGGARPRGWGHYDCGRKEDTRCPLLRWVLRPECPPGPLGLRGSRCVGA